MIIFWKKKKAKRGWSLFIVRVGGRDRQGLCKQKPPALHYRPSLRSRGHRDAQDESDAQDEEDAQDDAYLAQDDLWCKVLWRSTQRPRPPFYPLGKPKICDLQAKCMRCAAKRRQGEVYLEVALVV